MDLELTREQRQVQEKARAFASEYIAPVSARNDREEIFPEEILKALAGTGLMAPTLLPELGGLGTDFIGEALVFEEIGKVCASVRTILSVHNSLCALTIQSRGTEAQKTKYLSILGLGEILGCFALTEFSAGSEATNQNLMARPVARWVPYSTPDKSIYLCSSSTPRGGGVYGICGYHAARAAMRRSLQ